MAFFLKAIGLSDDIPGFPFTPVANDHGRIVYTSSLLGWTVRAGVANDDAQRKVAIFTCSLPSSSSSHNNELVKQLARSALRRAKSLMIPGFLKCLGATEYRDTVYIATEECISLKEVLESFELRTRLYGATTEEYHASVAYGISTVGDALCSLHQNRLVHGNVNCQSVFVSPSSGVWKLFGLELVSSPDEIGSNNPNCVFDNARRAGVLEGYHCPPELSSTAATSSGGSSNTGGGTDAFAMDSWGLAGLLYETVGVTAQEAVDGKLDSVVHTLASAELRNACRQSLPKSLHSGCAGITAANPRMRKSVQAFLEHCEFVKDCPFVQYMKGLSEALLLDVTQQVRLVESLTDVIDTFPLRPCLCCVLPRLGELIRAAAKPNSPNGAAGVSIGPVVAPVLKVAARTSAGDDFDTNVTPVLVQMFRCADVLMRYKLLMGAEVYGGKIASAALNNTIWPLYAKGFQYSTPSVREYSARALVHLAPHLSEAVLGDQVPKALALLQRDQDGALRANATIALHLISSYITPPSQRASVMLTYCRPMLRDAFEPSRVAALRSLRGAIECLTAKQLAEAVLPAVAPLTVDPSSEESRDAAIALIKAALVKLEENHKHLTAQQPTVPGSPSAAMSGEGSKPSSPQPATDRSHSASGNNNNSSSSRGWGLFNGSPPATPAASAASTLPAATTTTTTTTTAAAIATVKASPSPSSVSSSAHAVTTLPVPVMTATATAAGGGWSDDDDNDDEKPHTSGEKANDGWGDDDEDDEDGGFVKPATTTTAAAMKVRPLGLSSDAASSRPATAPFPGSTATKPLSSSSTAAKPHTSGATTFAASPLPVASSASNVSGVSTPAGSSGSPASNTAPSGPMKLRKKGGLGAARLD